MHCHQIQKAILLSSVGEYGEDTPKFPMQTRRPVSMFLIGLGVFRYRSFLHCAGNLP
jgi:hypothetical protein